MKRLDAIIHEGQYYDIVHRPSTDDVEWLIDRVRQLEAALRLIEFAGEFCDEAACSVCLRRYFEGHTADCAVGKALAAI